jgi:hypothetical protein
MIILNKYVEINKHLIIFNSFNNWQNSVILTKNNIKKFFNFYIIFYMFNIFSKVVIQSFIKFKKKLVILKSPFHFKLFKHHLIYCYYTIRCWFFFLSKYLNTLNNLFKLLFFFNFFKKSKFIYYQQFKLNNLFL